MANGRQCFSGELPGQEAGSGEVAWGWGHCPDKGMGSSSCGS